jgi:hypothetical protein
VGSVLLCLGERRLPSGAQVVAVVDPVVGVDLACLVVRADACERLLGVRCVALRPLGALPRFVRLALRLGAHRADRSLDVESDLLEELEKRLVHRGAEDRRHRAGVRAVRVPAPARVPVRLVAIGARHHPAAARSAAKQSADENVRSRGRAPLHHRVPLGVPQQSHRLERLHVDDRLVTARVLDALEANRSDVSGVGENRTDDAVGEPPPVPGADPVGIQTRRDRVHAVTGDIVGEDPSDDGRLALVDHPTALTFLADGAITERCASAGLASRGGDGG